MTKIKLMLIDDHNVFREGLKKLLDMDENFTIIAEAGSCQEALNNVNQHVEVILLDIGLPDGDGLDLCGKIRENYPEIKYVALTTYDDAIFIRKAMECGVLGFVPKYAFFDEIKASILMTVKGRPYLYPGLSTDTIFNLSAPGLSEQELTILQLLANGKNQKEVATELFISLSTLRRRLHSIFSKLGVHTVEEAMAATVKRGLIS